MVQSSLRTFLLCLFVTKHMSVCSSLFFSWPVSPLIDALVPPGLPCFLLALYLTLVNLFSLHLTTECCHLVTRLSSSGVTLSHPVSKAIIFPSAPTRLQHGVPDLVCWGFSRSSCWLPVCEHSVYINVNTLFHFTAALAHSRPSIWCSRYCWGLRE